MANLKVRFMDMGLGDCIVVKLPGGEVLMVDCGSRRNLPDAADCWNNMKTLVGGRIHALVLTHPDRDHYSQLAAVIPNTVAIDAVYHSSDRAKYRGLGNLVARQVWGLNMAKVFPVTLNAGGCVVGTTAVGKTPNGQAVGLRQRDQRGFLKILESNTNPKCTVWILASNVLDQSPSEAERRNAGSIVTLIEYGTAKVLLTGDSRIETEGFLTSYASASLTNVTLVQMPHHGSCRDTFSDTFIQDLNADIVVASDIPENGDSLPDKGLLQKYAQYAATLPNGASNTLRCWGVARQVVTQKRKRGVTVNVTNDITDIITLNTTKKLWSTDGHAVEVELNSNGVEVS